MCIPKTSSRGSSGAVPGWTAEVEPVRQDSIFWHVGSVWTATEWHSCRYHETHTCYVRDTIRSVNQREQDIVNERFAQFILSHNDRDFWSEVKRIRNHRVSSSNVVDNISNAPDIAEIFWLTSMRICTHVLLFVLQTWIVLRKILPCYVSRL